MAKFFKLIDERSRRWRSPTDARKIMKETVSETIGNYKIKNRQVTSLLLSLISYVSSHCPLSIHSPLPNILKFRCLSFTGFEQQYARV